MENIFFTVGGRSQRPVPNRAYVRFDQGEVIIPPDENEPGFTIIKLEGVDANWFDDMSRKRTGDERYFLMVPLLIIEIKVRFDVRSKIISGMATFGLTDSDESDTDYGNDWFEIWIGNHSGSGEVTLEVYQTLFGEPDTRLMEDIRPVQSSVEVKLRAELMIRPGEFPDATENQLRSAFRYSSEIDHAVVYDVGQGSATGLCKTTDNGSSFVVAYVDFGGGVTQHANTFPQQLSTFCMSAAPPNSAIPLGLGSLVIRRARYTCS